jgi:hypothetical protein
MGMIAELFRVVSSSLKTLNGAPGRQIVATGKGLGNVDTQAEVYNPAGVFSRTPKGARVLMLPIAGGKTRAIIGMVNYQLTLDIGEGETLIYSTSADGTTKKAEIKLDATGNITLNGNSKTFVTHAELNTALQTFITALNLHVHGSAGTPPVTPMSLNISAAATTTVKTGG